MIEIKLGKSCGSCLNSNRPKQPRKHAAHYEVAKTERWCFKHNCHVSRECTCDDYDGVNRSAKTSYSRILKFNKRIELVKEILELINRKEIVYGSYTFFKKDDWLHKRFDNSSYTYRVSTKDSSCDKYFPEILKQLKNGR
jgi:hypothetical protein